MYGLGYHGVCCLQQKSWCFMRDRTKHLRLSYRKNIMHQSQKLRPLVKPQHLSRINSRSFEYRNVKLLLWKGRGADLLDDPVATPSLDILLNRCVESSFVLARHDGCRLFVSSFPMAAASYLPAGNEYRQPITLSARRLA